MRAAQGRPPWSDAYLELKPEWDHMKVWLTPTAGSPLPDEGRYEFVGTDCRGTANIERVNGKYLMKLNPFDVGRSELIKGRGHATLKLGGATESAPDWGLSLTLNTDHLFFMAKMAILNEVNNHPVVKDIEKCRRSVGKVASNDDLEDIRLHLMHEGFTSLLERMPNDLQEQRQEIETFLSRIKLGALSGQGELNQYHHWRTNVDS